MGVSKSLGEMAYLLKKLRLRTALIFLVFVVLGTISESVRELDCGFSGGTIPKGNNRICTVKFETGWLFWRDHCEEEYEARNVTEFSVYTGMTISVECLPFPDVADQKVGLYRKNEAVVNLSRTATHTFNNFQVVDAGQYECRLVFANGTKVSSIFFNITASAGM